MINLSPIELKAVAKIRGIKGYISSKPVRKGEKSKSNFSEARIEKIRKEFNKSRYKFHQNQ